jgi:hypothetical protein
MKILAILAACALAGTAAAQGDAKSGSRQPLNLRLDEGTSAAPRVTFGPSPSNQTKEEREKGLPDLGGKPNDAYTRPISSPTSSGAVIPNAMDPATNSSTSTYGGR